MSAVVTLVAQRIDSVRATVMHGVAMNAEMTAAQLSTAAAECFAHLTTDQARAWILEHAADYLAEERAEGVRQGHADAMGGPA